MNMVYAVLVFTPIISQCDHCYLAYMIYLLNMLYIEEELFCFNSSAYKCSNFVQFILRHWLHYLQHNGLLENIFRQTF
ncbi:hypothetical protein XELAEV_18009345mg [Xenopus laevis]|uniref:Uncharacterized protein n=1 Tax=Xenopus laevis TaxID=8355 RepID=A0A974DUN3_XENLA|nr:hypothetical protein XELAEV_18009345mg [Xenopus laevis]